MDDTLLDIVRLIKGRLRSMAMFVGSVILITLIICLFLPNYYQGKTSFYAASEDLSRPEVIFGSSGERSYVYGGRNEQDRLLVVAENGIILDSLLQRHDLYAHYDIRPDDPRARLKLHNTFNKYFDVTRTDLDLIELTYLDKNQEFCALIANDTREVINNVAMQVVSNAQRRMEKTLIEKLRKDRMTLQKTTDSLDMLKRKNGLYDTENQIGQLAEILTTSSTNLASEQARLSTLEKSPGVRRDTLNHIRSRIAGLKEQVRLLTSSDSSSSLPSIHELNRILPTLKNLESRYFAVRSEIIQNEVQLAKVQQALASNPPALLTVEAAGVPIDKHSPRRSIIMVITTILAVLVYIVGVTLYQGYDKNIKHL